MSFSVLACIRRSVFRSVLWSAPLFACLSGKWPSTRRRVSPRISLPSFLPAYLSVPVCLHGSLAISLELPVTYRQIFACSYGRVAAPVSCLPETNMSLFSCSFSHLAIYSHVAVACRQLEQPRSERCVSWRGKEGRKERRVDEERRASFLFSKTLSLCRCLPVCTSLSLSDSVYLTVRLPVLVSSSFVVASGCDESAF